MYQPANNSSPKSKKQPKAQTTNMQRPLQLLTSSLSSKSFKSTPKPFLVMGKDLSGTIMLYVQGKLNANSRKFI
jgi:hypothetical protein